ncbi:MAG: DUF6683 family protein [Rubrivivax sp.]
MRNHPARRLSPHDRAYTVLVASIGRHLMQTCRGALVALGGDDDVTLTIARGTTPQAPAVLAASHAHAPACRAMQAVYERCLAHYRDVVRPADAARGVDDVGAAAAHFVAENVRALRGATVDAGARRPLERQLGALLQATPAWTRASAQERQLWFEKLATLAVFMHEAADQAVLQGDAAIEHVRQAAGGYLRELLGVDPDRLDVGPEGMSLRLHGAWAPHGA